MTAKNIKSWSAGLSLSRAVALALVLGACGADGTGGNGFQGSAASAQSPSAIAEARYDALTPEEKLTPQRIFASGDFRGDYFGGYSWLKGQNGYVVLERAEGDAGGRDVVLYDPETGARSILIAAKAMTPEGATSPIAVQSFEFSDDGKHVLLYTNSKRVWRRNTQGDYWVLRVEDGALWQVGEGFPASSLMFAKFSPDGTKVAYVQKTGRKIHDLYVENLADKAKTRLTSDGSETIINGTFDWAYEEEFGLRDGFRWSPDSSRIAYWQLDSEGVKDFTMINNTDSLYPKLVTFPYPKVGETNSAARIGVVSATGGDTTWMTLADDPRMRYLAYMTWDESGKEILIQDLNRRQNENRVWMADAQSGDARVIMTDSDDAWLDPVSDFLWLDGGQSFLWVSEEGGWRQIFRVSADGTSKTLITPGEYDVVRIIRVDVAGGYIYFQGSHDDPQRLYLYRVPIAGGEAEKLTPVDQKGWHSYSVSLDGKYAFNTWSALDKPTQIELVALPDHKQLKSFVKNEKLEETYNGLALGKTEFFQITSADDVTMEGVMHFPKDFDSSKKYPVIFYVYGEPAGMTGADRWSGSRMLWSHMMTQRGYIAATVDNRGQPAPKGRAWRKSIYRTLGLTNVNDQAAAVKTLLAERPYMDADRIGIWGHSGGGTSTLHALFRHGDVYKVGVSRAPVPDLRLYDTIYQERYSGILPEDADFYERAVAINYAQDLTGKLLLIHGTGDDNVHYQGSERLINKLVENNIQFDFFSYPNRTHGIWEGKNTSLHMHIMQTNYFLDHLPAGAR